MPQEFHILKCFSCEMFQVLCITKAKKWQCKVCREKQSIKRNYGLGSAKDCRLQVQKLNKMKLSVGEEHKLCIDESFEEDLKDENILTDSYQKNLTYPKSKWNKYLKENENDSEEDERKCNKNSFSSKGSFSVKQCNMKMEVCNENYLECNQKVMSVMTETDKEKFCNADFKSSPKAIKNSSNLKEVTGTSKIIKFIETDEDLDDILKF